MCLLNFDEIRRYFCQSNVAEWYSEALEKIQDMLGRDSIVSQLYLEEVHQLQKRL